MATSMSSRILDPDTPIEPRPWRAARHGYATGGQESAASPYFEPSGVQTGRSHREEPDEGHHHPGDEARLRELEGSVKLLERHLEDEKRSAHEQGRQQGLTTGVQQEAAKWTEALARLTRAVEEMSKSKARFRAEVEEDAVKLALAIARKVLNRELTSDPEALAGLARVALDKLNLRELQRVRVHPADAPAIERMLSASSAPKRVEVIADGTLERGGAIFETDHGTLDASVTTQLSEIERGLTDMLGGQAK